MEHDTGWIREQCPSSSFAALHRQFLGLKGQWLDQLLLLIILIFVFMYLPCLGVVNTGSKCR
jgi:hypothetical protein